MSIRDGFHFSADEVASILAGALAVVAELEVADDLKVPAFQGAVDLLSAAALPYPRPVGLRSDTIAVEVNGG